MMTEKRLRANDVLADSLHDLLSRWAERTTVTLTYSEAADMLAAQRGRTVSWTGIGDVILRMIARHPADYRLSSFLVRKPTGEPGTGWEYGQAKARELGQEPTGTPEEQRIEEHRRRMISLVLNEDRRRQMIAEALR